MISAYDPKKMPDYVQKLKVQSNIRAHEPTTEAKNNDIVRKGGDIPDTYDAFEKDIAMVHFYFKNPTTFEYRRYRSLTTEGFLSQIGGLFGLCLGFSFLSCVEILYWTTIRLGRNCRQARQAVEDVPPAASYKSPPGVDKLNK